MNLPNSTSSKSVLIVDNNVQETAILNEWFQRSGFQVEVVSNAYQAIAHVRHNEYRLVMVDMNLGDEIGGFETIWLMKTLVKDTRFVLLSEKKKITRENEQRAWSNGVYHWIGKPIKRKTVAKEISQILLEKETVRKPKQTNWLKAWIIRFTGNRKGGQQ